SSPPSSQWWKFGSQTRGNPRKGTRNEETVQPEMQVQWRQVSGGKDDRPLREAGSLTDLRPGKSRLPPPFKRPDCQGVLILKNDLTGFIQVNRQVVSRRRCLVKPG